MFIHTKCSLYTFSLAISDTTISMCSSSCWRSDSRLVVSDPDSCSRGQSRRSTRGESRRLRIRLGTKRRRWLEHPVSDSCSRAQSRKRTRGESKRLRIRLEVHKERKTATFRNIVRYTYSCSGGHSG